MTALTALAPQPVRATAALVALVSTLALCGAALALSTLTRDGEAPYFAREAPSAGAWEAPTSFGTIAVERVERFEGVPGGMGHAGVGGHSDRVRISLRLSNDGRATVPFSPGQLRLAFGRGRSADLPPTRPNPPPGSIAGGATLDQQLEYVVPAVSAAPTLVFADLGSRRPVEVELGSVPGRERR